MTPDTKTDPDHIHLDECLHFPSALVSKFLDLDSCSQGKKRWGDIPDPDVL